MREFSPSTMLLASGRGDLRDPCWRLFCRDTTLRNGDTAESYQHRYAGIALNSHVIPAGLPKLDKAYAFGEVRSEGVQLRNSLRSFELESVL